MVSPLTAVGTPLVSPFDFIPIALGLTKIFGTPIAAFTGTRAFEFLLHA